MNTVELIYGNTYATFANDWQIATPSFFGLSFTIKNTTKDKIANHSMGGDMAWPHLPLM